MVKSWQTEGSLGEQGSHVDEGTAASPVARTLQARKAWSKVVFLQPWVPLGVLGEANSQTVGVHTYYYPSDFSEPWLVISRTFSEGFNNQQI